MSEWTDLGRSVVADGRLEELRHRLGLNRSSMAYLLQTAVAIYTSWERRPEMTLRPATATRVGRFYHLAELQWDLMKEEGIDIKQLIPLHHALTQLGVPQELLLRMYRNGAFHAEDLGILGLWVYEEDLELIRDRL